MPVPKNRALTVERPDGYSAHAWFLAWIDLGFAMLTDRSKEIKMETYDDDLSRFEAEGAAPLPVTQDQGYVEHDGARIWYAAYGSGSPVILLHGGLGHSGNWGYQVPALVEQWLSCRCDRQPRPRPQHARRATVYV